MGTPRHAMQDTRKSDGCYVQFERVIEEDDSGDAPDDRDEGFWPSKDRRSAGYVGESNFDEQHAIAVGRMGGWKRGNWSYVGVRARALCFVVQNGTGTHFSFESPGCWGIESDAGEYLNEIYAQEVANLKDIIAAMASPTFEGQA